MTKREEIKKQAARSMEQMGEGEEGHIEYKANVPVDSTAITNADEKQVKTPKQAKVPREQMKRRQAKPASGQARFKLTVHGLPDHLKGYWAREEDIQSFRDRDYFLVGKDNIGSVGADEDGNVSVSSAVCVNGGSDGKKLYLMAIRREYYEQDQAAAEHKIQSHEKHIYNPDKKLYSDHK